MNKSIVLAAGLLLGCLACVKDSETPAAETIDFRTTAFFISNKDTLRFDDNSVNTTVTWSVLKSYSVSLWPTLRIISDSLQPKLYQG